jgi:apolipoprotein D and lipocalin family protein
MRILIVLFLLFPMVVAACAGGGRDRDLPPLATVSRVDLDRYLGTWYEIARLPNWFERGCVGTTAFYEKIEGGRIRVINRCRKETLEGKPKEARGVAWVVDTTTNARLKVRFFWPFAGDYWIIGLDEDYRWAVVGDPSRRYLWFLARTPVMDETTYSKLEALARAAGFDTDRLERPEQFPDRSPER